MLILLEGNECSGKSTLAKKLTENGGRVVHFGAPTTPEEAANYYKVYIRAMDEVKPNELVVFDRCWVSDTVYGPVMRGTQEMSFEMANLLNAYASQHGGILIYCHCDWKTLVKRYTSRGDDYITSVDKLRELQATYNQNIKLMKNIPVMYYDTGR